MSGFWAEGIRSSLGRGWNVFVIDGSGPRSMLFERDVSFCPDWEKVRTPVIDTLVTRDDLDPDALLAYAISQGGYWLGRALAFEHRFLAAVLDGGVVDVSQSWNANLPPEMLDLLRHGQRQTFDQRMAQGPSDSALERRLASAPCPSAPSTRRTTSSRPSVSSKSTKRAHRSRRPLSALSIIVMRPTRSRSGHYPGSGGPTT